MLSNFMVLFKLVSKEKISEKSETLFGHTGKEYSEIKYEKIELGKQRVETILLTAFFTAWISPCIVMLNNFVHKSYFLIASSITNLVGHLIGFISILIYSIFADLCLQNNPPITHCFKQHEYDKMEKYFLNCIIVFLVL